MIDYDFGPVPSSAEHRHIVESLRQRDQFKTLEEQRRELGFRSMEDWEAAIHNHLHGYAPYTGWQESSSSPYHRGQPNVQSPLELAEFTGEDPSRLWKPPTLPRNEISTQTEIKEKVDSAVGGGIATTSALPRQVELEISLPPGDSLTALPLHALLLMESRLGSLLVRLQHEIQEAEAKEGELLHSSPRGQSGNDSQFLSTYHWNSKMTEAVQSRLRSKKEKTSASNVAIQKLDAMLNQIKQQCQRRGEDVSDFSTERIEQQHQPAVNAAVTLNTDSKRDPVKEALASGEWEEKKDPKTGRTYYVNRKTKKTTWDLAKELSQQPSSSTQPTISTTATATSVAAALASGEWDEKKDPKTGRTYYYNRKTKKTTWDLAKELAASSSAPNSVTQGVNKVAAALASGEWEEKKDPKTGKTYYYNKKTKKTTWDLAKELT